MPGIPGIGFFGVYAAFWGNRAVDIGFDLGTATVLVCVKGKGIVLKEPSVIAVDARSGSILAIGEEARRMVGRTPGTISAIRPMRNGVIADYRVTTAMLRSFLGKVCGRVSLVRPRLMISVPAGATEVEKKAVVEAALEAGARKAFTIKEPLAAALGAGIDITKPSGSMVVDIGGGTSDIAVLSLGGIVVSESIRVAGDEFDEAIIRHVKQEYNVAIGERMAEEAKIAAGAAARGLRDARVEVRGRDLVSGLPKTVTLTSDELASAVQEPVSAITEAVKSVLEVTPPELASDIWEKGIVLTGGGALLYGMDEVIRDATGLPTVLAEDPVSCVARGTERALGFSGVFHDYVKVLRRVL